MKAYSDDDKRIDFGRDAPEDPSADRLVLPDAGARIAGGLDSIDKSADPASAPSSARAVTHAQSL